jgi:hypothetical protein
MAGDGPTNYPGDHARHRAMTVDVLVSRNGAIGRHLSPSRSRRDCGRKPLPPVNDREDAVLGRAASARVASLRCGPPHALARNAAVSCGKVDDGHYHSLYQRKGSMWVDRGWGAFPGPGRRRPGHRSPALRLRLPKRPERVPRRQHPPQGCPPQRPRGGGRARSGAMTPIDVDLAILRGEGVRPAAAGSIFGPWG